MKACVEAGVLTIPQSKIVYKNGRGRHIAGWNEYVEPLRNRSLMWHQIWKGQGSPKEGYISQIMSKTRAENHYAIKVLRRN